MGFIIVAGISALSAQSTQERYSTKTYECYVQFVDYKRHPQIKVYGHGSYKLQAEWNVRSIYEKKAKIKSVECV